ncbi:MAG: flagellar biosynthesis protein FlhA [Magnetococcales bacterium]|nr:flagellar biosynthesis protein FlhA [Magnetococcales bacterium]MBF0151574.1 flagellar biosynthesis protein FlhA [Magnetococcales bacterium]MBF0172413.1 flagellar biosynthesis protein FlhA [Magnetococcales bacterium]MBF0631041.1 flagellar biosynthesis protein FlhA [Magnetococcales bacterium]
MAVGIIVVLMVMIIPLPPMLLDLFLSVNISMGIVILLTTVYIHKPLDFSSFPSILLITTMFRLALNIATTRLILLHGSDGEAAAGEVIRSFGQFVVGGNTVVGVIVFTILVIINFVVITKGAGRIAEVAARFTLDKMPGKQMAVDADLNSGLISESEAKARRKEIEAESEFFGAMDGASKFVRGDAVAGIIITLVNIVGGFIIGVISKGMTASEAANIYTILTVGDGLVNQIPALVISTAAGFLVTRASTDQNLADHVGGQITANPRVILLSSGVLGLFAIIPGMPTIPFATLAISMGIWAYFLFQRREAKERAVIREEAVSAQEVAQQEEPIETFLALDLLRLDVGYGLISLVDESQHGTLLDKIRSIRKQFAVDMGFVVPPIHIKDNLQFRPGEYAFYIKGVEVGRGELKVGHFLAMEGGAVTGQIEGTPTKEPAFGLPAIWITAHDRERAEMLGYTVVDAATVLATHITELIHGHAHEMLNRQEVQTLLDMVTKTQPKLVDELIPNVVNLGGVQKVLQGLLRERVSIRDMTTILETMADFAKVVKQPQQLVELVRQSLSRSLVNRYLEEDGSLRALVLGADAENMINEAIVDGEYGSYLSLAPRSASLFLNQLRGQVEKVATQVVQPIIITGARARPFVKQATESSIPHLVVLSQNEIPSNIQIYSLGTVSVS